VARYHTRLQKNSTITQDSSTVSGGDVGMHEAQPARRYARESVHKGGDRNGGRIRDKKVHAILLAVEFNKISSKVSANVAEDNAQRPQVSVAKDAPTIF
jgi:hypothetical protein